MKKALIAVMAAVLGANLFADSYNGVTYSTSKDVEPGKWFSNFNAVLKYANDNNVPMVVFWGSEGCGHCAKVEKQMAKSGFTDWMKESGLVFAFVVSGKTPGGTAKEPKLYARYGSEFPYVGVYWNKNTKGNKVGGKAKDGQTNFPSGHFGGRIGEKGWSKLRDKIVSYIKDWTPVKGGLFDIDETKEKSAGNRLEVSKESGTVLISLTRPTSAVQKACDDDIMRVTYKDGTVVSNILSWAAGQSTMEYSLELNTGKLKAGEAVTLEMLNGPRVVSTSSVTVVSDENSAANPLWTDERTVAEPPRKSLLMAAAKGDEAPALQFGEWTMDIDTATQTVAKATGKAYTLVAIQGSLWCHDCANTERNFLDVTNAAGENMVKAWATDEKQVALVSIDIPDYNEKDPNGEKSTCLLSRNAVETTLAYEMKDYGMFDVSQGGAPESLTKPQVRSGAGYMSRKGIGAEEAAEQLAKFKFLVSTDTDKGGFYRPEGENIYENDKALRTGVPIFVLLRKDGTVAARLTYFSKKSPMKFAADGKTLIATEEFVGNVLKRFDEMIAIADAEPGSVDASEIENNGAGEKSIASESFGVAAEGRLSHADIQDVFRIVGMTGAAKQTVKVWGDSDAKVEVQLLSKDRITGKISNVGDSVDCTLSAGATLSHVFESPADCFVCVRGKDITSDAFRVDSGDADHFTMFSVSNATEILLPQQGMATAKAGPDGKLTISLENGKNYRLVGIVDPDSNVLVRDGDSDIYKAQVTADVPVKVDGELTYQEWVPGKIRFVPPTEKEDKASETNGAMTAVAMNETDANGVTVKIERYDGVSGDVKVEFRIDQDATDCFYDLWPWKPGEPATYKQMPRFTVNDQWEIVTNEADFATLIGYPDNSTSPTNIDTFVFKPNALAFKELQKSYYGNQRIVIRVRVEDDNGYVQLIGRDGQAADEITYVITIKDDAKQQKPGTVYFKEGASLFSKTGPYTVYARKSSSVDISIGRTDPANGVVATAFTKSKGSKMVITGVEDAENPLAGFQPLLARQGWGNRDISDKVITVLNLPAVGKSETITLKPVSPLKVKSSSTKTVKIVSVADDATEFEEREYCFSNLLRYVSCTCPCPLKETGSGTLSAKKLRGSIPSGLSAKLLTEVSEDESTTNTVLCFSGYPTKAGTYTAYYQVVENRGTKKKPKNYGGLPVKVVFKVYDPVTAGTSDDPAIAAIANPSVASTRTLNDLMVFGPYAETNRLAGKLKLTIPRTGKVSAKYVCNGGTISFSAKGWEPKDPYAGEVSGDLTATLKATKKAWTNYTLTVTAETNGVVTASIGDPYYEGTELEAWSDGKVWTAGDKKKKIPAHSANPWKGLYTVSLMPGGAKYEYNAHHDFTNLPGRIVESEPGFAPRGCGYLTFKMTSSSAINAGKMTWGGKLPNGTSVSGTTVLTEELVPEEYADDPEWTPTYAYLPIFTRFTTKVTKKTHTTLDRLSAIARIEKSMNEGGKEECLRAVWPAEDLARGEWVHQVTKPSTNETAGALDFSMDIHTFGSRFDPNKSLGTCCAESYKELTQWLNISNSGWFCDGSESVEIAPVAITVTCKSKPKDDKIKVDYASGVNNPCKVTLSLSRSSGVVSGSFKLPYKVGETVKYRDASWRGVLLVGWGCSTCCSEPTGIFLPFINGYYTFSDTAEYETPAGTVKKLSVKRGETVWSSDRIK